MGDSLLFVPVRLYRIRAVEGEAEEGEGVQPCGSCNARDVNRNALRLVALHHAHSTIPFPALRAAGDDTNGNHPASSLSGAAKRRRGKGSSATKLRRSRSCPVTGSS